MERMNEQHEQLRRELADQRAYIEESIKRRDEQLMDALRQMLEARREAAQKKWWKFWK